MSHINNTEARRKNTKAHIIEIATQAFHKEGIKNVTMDDIAHRLTMSKRTLYQLFSDKEDLLLACATQRDAESRIRMAQLSERTDNVLSLLLCTWALSMHDMELISPNFFTEILKYPRVIAHFEKNNRIRENEAVEFLNKGIAQGYFRANVNFHIVYNQLSTGIHQLISKETMNKYSLLELYINTVVPYIRGCATLKGIELIDKFMEDSNNDIEQLINEQAPKHLA